MFLTRERLVGAAVDSCQEIPDRDRATGRQLAKITRALAGTEVSWVMTFTGFRTTGSLSERYFCHVLPRVPTTLDKTSIPFSL